MNIKRILTLLIELALIHIIGCNNDEKEKMPTVEKYHTILGKYGIKIGEIDESYSYIERENEAWLLGRKGNKYWLRQYHKTTFKLIKQCNLLEGAEYNTIQCPVESPTEYLFFARRMNADPVSKNGYIIAEDNGKEVVDLVYTLTKTSLQKIGDLII